jgi:hypothetical protein
MKRALITALSLLAAGCASLKQPTGSPIDPALLLLVPSGANSMLWISVEKLVKTEGYAQLAKSDMVSGTLDLLAAQTTYDPRKKFWQVLVVSNGASSVLLARGDFAPLGMEPEFKKEGAQRSNYKGQSIITTGGIMLSFMSPSCLAVGSRPAIEWFIDAQGQRGGPPKLLLEQAQKIDRKNQIWWTTSTPSVFIPSQTPATGGFSNIVANLPRLMNGLQAMTGSIDFTTGLSLILNAEFSDATHAKDSSSSLNAFIALAKATAPKPMYDRIKIEQSESKVRISVDAPISSLTQ